MANLELKKNIFGMLSDGSEIELYTVNNGKMSFSSTNYGCTLTSILLPAGNGKKVDVLLGFSTLEGWVMDGLCFGTGVGRFANRIGGCTFEIDGKKYRLDDNDSGRTLHGGFDRWEKKVWSPKEVETKYGRGVEYSRVSPDGEQGFPGNLDVKQIFTLNEDNVLTLEYYATTDTPTPVNITNHAYFNMKGYDGGTVKDHEIMFKSEKVLEIGEDHLPSGKILDVEGTPFDFRTPRLLSTQIEKLKFGFDDCYCVPGFDEKDFTLREFGYVKDPASGRKMSVKTTQPGIQFYTANFLNGEKGKNGHPYGRQEALCLETQGYPDAPNHPEFPNTILRPGETYHQVTQYVFEF